MLRILFSFISFAVCTFWCCAFALNFRTNDAAKRLLTLFLATCSVLYFCHGLYFTIGLSHGQECLWTLCSLSVYPLYYIYICLLTSYRPSIPKLMMLLGPGFVVAVVKYVYPTPGADLARQILNIIQVLGVCYFGYLRLWRFDRALKEVYSDTEGKDTTAVKRLLVAFVITSLCSAVANGIGKQYFAQSEWHILAVLIPFAVMLYLLSYMGYTRTFTSEQYESDMSESDNPQSDAELPSQQSDVPFIIDEDLFLRQDLKIGDVVRRTGVCRTYVFNYINKEYGCSFSDYVNRLRVEYAKTLMKDSSRIKLSVIATQSGFSNEQAFYRNFRKFTGLTPQAWKDIHS